MAINGKSIKFLMPKLELFSCKNNHPSPELMRRMDASGIPPHFMI